MTTPTKPPAPLEWHPAYRDRTWLLDWVEGRTDHGYYLNWSTVRSRNGHEPVGP
jgi:hypothetical protein